MKIDSFDANRHLQSSHKMRLAVSVHSTLDCNFQVDLPKFTFLLLFNKLALLPVETGPLANLLRTLRHQPLFFAAFLTTQRVEYHLKKFHMSPSTNGTIAWLHSLIRGTKCNRCKQTQMGTVIRLAVCVACTLLSTPDDGILAFTNVSNLLMQNSTRPLGVSSPFNPHQTRSRSRIWTLDLYSLLNVE